MAEESGDVTVSWTDVSENDRRFRPTFIKTPPPKRFRCTKGHEWEVQENAFYGTIRISFPEFGVNDVCLRCIAEFLGANMGKIEEIPATPTADTPTMVPKE